MTEFVKPTLEYATLWPLLLIFGFACLGVMVEAFAPRAQRYQIQVPLSVVGVVGAFAGVILVARSVPTHAEGAARGEVTAMGALTVDGPTLFLWGLILILALAGIVLFAERRLEGGLSAFAGQAAALPGTDAERQAAAKGLDHTEVYPLLMFAVGGMMLFPAASDLLMLFVALEVLSLPLYLLCGLARRRRLLSQEAAMKYFLLGAFSSGFFIYGVALIYGYAGSMDYAAINAAILNQATDRELLLIGIGLIMVGLLFKVGAAPFHSWTPDVYQGAPTVVTAFMSAATKVAAFGALLRLCYVALGAERWSWQPLLWVVAVLTMVVGAVLAIPQRDIKRLLAYSSVAHSGFLLAGVLGLTALSDRSPGAVTSLQSVLFYLTTYSFLTLGAFAIVSMVRDGSGEATDLRSWAGLGRREPVVAAVFTVLLLGMAGIPLTSGFIGKWGVFTAAGASGAWGVVVIAVIASAIALAVYVRVIRLMYFVEPDTDRVATVTLPSILTTATVGICVAATLVLGVVPGPVLDLVGRAGEFIR